MLSCKLASCSCKRASGVTSPELAVTQSVPLGSSSPRTRTSPLSSEPFMILRGCSYSNCTPREPLLQIVPVTSGKRSGGPGQGAPGIHRSMCDGPSITTTTTAPTATPEHADSDGDQGGAGDAGSPGGGGGNERAPTRWIATPTANILQRIGRPSVSGSVGQSTLLIGKGVDRTSKEFRK
jgi:hypothetical protein